jgi:capsular exopolysaccharide synthesis family protein
VLNTLGVIYPRVVQKQDQDRANKRIQQLRRRLWGDDDRASREAPGRDGLNGHLRELRSTLAIEQTKAGVDDPATATLKFSALVGKEAAVQKELRDLGLKKILTRGKLDAVQNSLDGSVKNPVSAAEINEELKDDRDSKALQDQLERLEARKRRLPRVYQRGQQLNELLQEVNESIAAVQSRLERLRETARANADRKRRNRWQIEARDLSTELQLLDAQEKKVLAEHRRLKSEMDSFRNNGPKTTPEVEALRDKVKQVEKEIEAVGQAVVALEAAQPVLPRVVVHTPAVVPTEKDLSRPIKFSLLTSVGMFVLVLTGLCLLEFRTRRVYSAGDVTEGLGLKVIGTLPTLPGAARSTPAALQSPAGQENLAGMTDAIDSIRTVLLHSPRLDGARVIMVASATSGEGKTTLASHLAASLARAWRKTLLIDCDLRKPAMHTQFDLPLDPGFCEALRGEIDFDDIVKPTQLSRLWMISAGKCDGHALQALAQEGVAGVFERLKEQFDFIVIDTSPVLPVTDPLLLGKHADAVLLTVMRDVSRIPAVYAAQKRLEALSIRVVGAVVIGEKVELYGKPIPYPRENAGN